MESLLIYLLNRDVVLLLDEYIEQHDASSFCPYMIMDKCIINVYKPSACQMYMPFTTQGKPVCFYLSGNQEMADFNGSTSCSAHSNSYAVHGFMLLIQQDIDRYLEQSWFKNIYDGTSWWRTHYDGLPQATRAGLESIINDDAAGQQQTGNFQFEESLTVGYQKYNDTVDRHEAALKRSAQQRQ